MGKFSIWLKHFAKLSKVEDFWRNKGEQAGLRGLCMGIAANASVLIGILAQLLSGSYFYAFIAATGSLWILFPLAIFIVSKHWKKRMRSVVLDDGDFNWRMFLEDEYEEQLRRIIDLQLDKVDTDKLKLEAYREHQEIVRLFQAKIAATPQKLHSVSVNDLRSIFQNIERDLMHKNPRKYKELYERLEQIEKRARYLSS